MSSFLRGIFGSSPKPQSPKKPQQPSSSQQQQQQSNNNTTTSRNRKSTAPNMNNRAMQQSPKCTPSKASLSTSNNNNNFVGARNHQSKSMNPPPRSPRPNFTSTSTRPTSMMMTGGGGGGSYSSSQQSSFGLSQQQNMYTNHMMMMGGLPQSQQAGPTEDTIRVVVRVRPAMTNTTVTSSSDNNSSNNNNTQPFLDSNTRHVVEEDFHSGGMNFAPALPRSALTVDDAGQRIFVVNRSDPFSFNRVLDETATQQDCFNIVARPLVEEAFKGYNSCIFAYGQSGSGKTYSLSGSNIKIEAPSSICSARLSSSSSSSPLNQEDSAACTPMQQESSTTTTEQQDEDDDDIVYPFRGIVPRVCKEIFNIIHKMSKNNMNNKSLEGEDDDANDCDLQQEASPTSDPSRTPTSSSKRKPHHNNYHPTNTTWMVSIGFVEIYNENVFDLLDPTYTQLAASFASLSQQQQQPQQHFGGLSQASSSIMPSSSSANNSNSNNSNNIAPSLGNSSASIVQQMNSKSLEVREDTSKGSTSRFFVEKQKFVPVTSAKQIDRLIEKGLNARRVAETCMNERSSRSHALFQIRLEEIPCVSSSSTSLSSSQQLPMTERLRSATINLVDLAGSENAKKTDAKGQQKVEGGHINKSLLALRQVIDERANNNSYVSYRNATLTKLLKHALGGNSKTVMLACVSPLEAHVDETVNTLRYAAKACTIINKVTVNERSLLSPGAVRPQEEVAMLTTQLRELEDQLDVEKKKYRELERQVKVSETAKTSLQQDLEGRKKLFELQEQEIAELKRQIDAARERERHALSAVNDAVQHFQDSCDDSKSQLSSLQKEHQQNIKKLESAKNAKIKKLEQEIEKRKSDAARMELQHEDIVQKLRQDAACEKKGLDDELQSLREKAATRETALLQKIADIEESFKKEKVIANDMFENQVKDMMKEHGQEKSALEDKCTSLESTISNQMKELEAARKREEKSVSHMQGLIKLQETEIKSLRDQEQKKVKFLEDRNKVLEERIEMLKKQILEKKRFEEEVINNNNNNNNIDPNAAGTSTSPQKCMMTTAADNTTTSTAAMFMRKSHTPSRRLRDTTAYDEIEEKEN